jgi:hypothetical protein
MSISIFTVILSVIKTDYKNISVNFYKRKQKVVVSVCSKTIMFAEYFDSLFLYNGPYLSPHPFFGYIPKLIQEIDEPDGVFIEFRTFQDEITAPRRVSAFRRVMSSFYAVPTTRYIFPKSCAEKELFSDNYIKNLIASENTNVDGKIEYRVVLKLYKDEAAFMDKGTTDSEEHLSPWFDLDDS